MLLALGILLFIGLVVVHELGHYLAAKRSGVEVEEFGLGFPPRLLGRHFGKDPTLYSINLLPLGGFVRLKGEHEDDKTKGGYGAASPRQKTFIITAGILMNLLVAVIIITVLSWTGMPKLLPNQFSVASDTEIVAREVVVVRVSAGSSADQAGIQKGDEISTFNGQPVDSAEQLFNYTEASLGQTVEVELERDEQMTTLNVNLPPERTELGILGVTPGEVIIEQSTWSAPIKGIVVTGQLVWETLVGIGNIFAQLFRGEGGQAADGVTGPVGIAVLLGDMAEAGAASLWLFIALISISLAVMNMLPIPALDGGRLYVGWLFRALKKPLDAKTEERINAVGYVLLFGLIILITVIDVKRF